MYMRKTLLAASLLLSLLLAGCGGNRGGSAQTQAPAESPAEAAAAQETASEETEPAGESDGEDYGTGDASLDDPRNQDGIGEQELLVVSFGTSYNDSRRKTIGAIENALEAAFPDYSVRRAFTSQIIIDHVARRDGEIIDNVIEALDRAAANGVKTLVVQPTHLMHGYEYSDLLSELEGYRDSFESIAVAEPLLADDEDFSQVADALIAALEPWDDGETALCLMGHGTEAESNGIYERMQEVLFEKGCDHTFVATVEAEPSFEDLRSLIQKSGLKKAVLMPLMVVAGDHANNDMAGEDEDSWKSMLVSDGISVECLLRGLGEEPAIQELYIKHTAAAIAGLSEPRIARSSDMTEVETVVPEDAEPLFASELREGSYPITVESSSSMFRIVECTLHVAQDSMTADLTMSGSGYLYCYPGTPEEADAAPEAERITASEDTEGRMVFTIPVSALDAPVECAAFSRAKELWYPRTLCFRSDSLPPEAFAD